MLRSDGNGCGPGGRWLSHLNLNRELRDRIKAIVDQALTACWSLMGKLRCGVLTPIARQAPGLCLGASTRVPLTHKIASGFTAGDV